MINLILHPGHSKCGSTTIQDFLYENRKLLLKRGVFLPDVNFNFPGTDEYRLHHTQTPRDYLAQVQNAKIPLSDLEGKLDYLIQQAKKNGCRRVIISAENLINAIHSPLTQKIHRLFNKKFSSVNLVYYVRKQSDLLVSAWQQWGHKNGESLSEYVNKMSKNSFVDFLAIANKFEDYYPNRNINIFPLSKKNLIKKDLITDFCFRAKIRMEGLNIKVESSNSGLSSALCETVSKISNIYSSPHDQGIKNSIVSLTPYSSKIRDKKYENDLSSSLCEMLIDKFETKNKALAEKYFPEVPFEKALSMSYLLVERDKSKDILNDKIEKLEDIVAIQMDMILELNNRLKNDK